MALPTFFVIGATKAGTTSLSRYLDTHPEISMSTVKEPHFFIQPGDGLPSATDRISTRAEYEQLFDPSVATRGEASTSYSHYPARGGVPERISESVPDAKFIYLVRDPVDRIVSHYSHQVSSEGERRSFEDSLGDVERPFNIYICASRYVLQLARYLAVYPSSRILVVDQSELLRNRSDTLAEIFTFLEVDSSFVSPEYDQTLNVSGDRRMYSEGYARFRGSGPLQRLPGPVRRSARGMAELLEKVIWPPIEAPEVPPELRGQLADLFRDEVVQLRAITGKGFQSWML